jgi:hypothetical protein
MMLMSTTMGTSSQRQKLQGMIDRKRNIILTNQAAGGGLFGLEQTKTAIQQGGLGTVPGLLKQKQAGAFKEEEEVEEGGKEFARTESAKFSLKTMKDILDIKMVNGKPVVSDKGRKQIWQSSLPGAIGARTYWKAQEELKDIILRLRTGAVINDDEMESMQKRMPGILDTDEDVAFNIKMWDIFLTNLSKHSTEDLFTGNVDLFEGMDKEEDPNFIPD